MELLIAMAIIGVLSSIAVAGYRHARIRGNEMSAIASLDAINKAQFAYMQACGNQRVAPTLVSLGVPSPESGHAFLSPDLTASDPISKSGYRIGMSGQEPVEGAVTCTGATPTTGYQATADPLVPGATGIRYFGSNADGVIYEDQASFTGNMPERGAPSHGHEIK